VFGQVAETFTQVFRCKSGPVDYEWGISSASTDFVRFMLIMIKRSPTERPRFRAT
jgi:hypothetical protein